MVMTVDNSGPGQFGRREFRLSRGKGGQMLPLMAGVGGVTALKQGSQKNGARDSVLLKRGGVPGCTFSVSIFLQRHRRSYTPILGSCTVLDQLYLIFWSLIFSSPKEHNTMKRYLISQILCRYTILYEMSNF